VKSVSRFRRVDSDAQASDLVAYLDQVAQLPEIERMRQCAFDLVAAELPRSILDLGCGTGDTTNRLSSLCMGQGGTIGADMSSTLLTVAQSKHPSIKFIRTDAAAITLDTASFDVCYAERVMIHIPELEASVTEIRRILKPQGLFASVEPDWLAAELDIGSRSVGGLFMANYIKDIAQASAPHAIRRICANQGWTLISEISSALVADTFDGADLVVRFANALKRMDSETRARDFENLQCNFMSFRLPFVVQAWRT